jgi:hypothetical protein
MTRLLPLAHLVWHAVRWYIKIFVKTNTRPPSPALAWRYLRAAR